jgi:hypothetical protein
MTQVQEKIRPAVTKTTVFGSQLFGGNGAVVGNDDLDLSNEVKTLLREMRPVSSDRATLREQSASAMVYGRNFAEVLAYRESNLIQLVGKINSVEPQRLPQPTEVVTVTTGFGNGGFGQLGFGGSITLNV